MSKKIKWGREVEISLDYNGEINVTKLLSQMEALRRSSTSEGATLVKEVLRVDTSWWSEESSLNLILYLERDETYEEKEKRENSAAKRANTRKKNKQKLEARTKDNDIRLLKKLAEKYPNVVDEL